MTEVKMNRTQKRAEAKKKVPYVKVKKLKASFLGGNRKKFAVTEHNARLEATAKKHSAARPTTKVGKSRHKSSNTITKSRLNDHL
jgi:hypothetical protein